MTIIGNRFPPYQPARPPSDESLAGHQVKAAGLATGGGALDTNPTITVTAATTSEAQAGTGGGVLTAALGAAAIAAQRPAASQAEAEAGAAQGPYMDPLRTKQAIDKRFISPTLSGTVTLGDITMTTVNNNELVLGAGDFIRASDTGGIKFGAQGVLMFRDGVDSAVAFVSSAPNTKTEVVIDRSGTPATDEWALLSINRSAGANEERFNIIARGASADYAIGQVVTGTGSYRPVHWYQSGNLSATWNTDGSWQFDGAAAGHAVVLANNKQLSGRNAANSGNIPIAFVAGDNSIALGYGGSVLGLYGPVLLANKTGRTLANGLNSNIDAGSSSFVRITGPTAAFSLGGFQAGADGRVLRVYNSVAFAMTIVNEDASSTVGNRIKTLTGANVVLRAGTSFADFIYDGTDGRWILTGTN